MPSGAVLRHVDYPSAAGGGKPNPGLLSIQFRVGYNPGLYQPTVELIVGNGFQFTVEVPTPLRCREERHRSVKAYRRSGSLPTSMPLFGAHCSEDGPDSESCVLSRISRVVEVEVFAMWVGPFAIKSIAGKKRMLKEIAVSNIGKGLMAGLAATVVLSVLMVMKAMLGVMPALDLPKMIAGMMGSPDTPLLGWAVHFMIGIVVYGIVIATLGDRLGSNSTVSGIVIGVVGWLIMMVMLMPMAGVGLFAMSMGVMAPVMTLVLHLVFGAVLGWTYGKLVSSNPAAFTVRA